jgi:iron(III) transport system permease protein
MLARRCGRVCGLPPPRRPWQGPGGWLLAMAGLRLGAARWVNALCWLSMLWPAALTGLAVAGSGLADVLGSAAALLLGHALRLLPFATWVMLAVLGAQPRGPTEQLYTLGVRGWASWRHGHWPAARWGLSASLLLCAGLSLAELTVTVLTVPPGTETVILRLYNLLHYGDQRGVMLLALLQGLLVAALVAAGMSVGARGGRGGVGHAGG